MNTYTSYQFGPQDLGGGRTVFRLWAPSATRVDLFVETADKTGQHTMQQAMNGWFSTMVEVAAPCLYWFRIDENQTVPDPASRFQPHDVHGPSLLVPPSGNSGKRRDIIWRGRPWQETVIYEMHVGAFTPQGTLAAAAEKLDYLKDLGITAIELMPLADFPGNRNWGYDGALLFAPDSSYGTAGDLHRFIALAHARELMVFLDVVYNHFGPEGNYLHVYAEPFFTDRHKTPWGSAIDFEGPQAQAVRRFFIENTLYWLEEYGFDGLRFDAVHAIFDDSKPHILEELARTVQEGPGRDRHIHLMLENDNNTAGYLRWQTATGEKKNCYAAQWNDDIHHAYHFLLTGESEGYYQDYRDAAIDHLGRCLCEGFAWQGERSPYRGRRPRGESSADLMPTRFIAFLQNHDQTGNRALGERLARLTRPESLRAATAALLLGPAIPLLFMGQEWATSRPFFFFCDFQPELAALVTAGRREEFADFAQFHDPRQRQRIPDPNREETFQRSILDWREVEENEYRQWLLFHRQLLQVRRERVVPLLDKIVAGKASYRRLGSHSLRATWPLQDGRTFVLLLNLGERPVSEVRFPEGEIIWTTGEEEKPKDILAPFFCGWYLSPAGP
ncbi:MAG: 1,4-alpha-glucan branching protein [Desulfobulbaceae bacterium BRH_c16a]|nr:MAG: 1,4-alpha-glucan branching protein [Desulfobulbaceae bacterium BRH_c16a]